jgi:integrase
MVKILHENETIKRKYFERCVDAKGQSTKTLEAKELAILKFEEFNKHQSFKLVKTENVKEFKKWLGTTKSIYTKKLLDKTTQYHTLRHLKEFFLWLSDQNGYKSRINSDIFEYFRLSRADSKIATTSKQPSYPTLSYILKLTSFDTYSDIDLRDRALIAFTALSGMRDLAIVSLPMGCFNPTKLEVDQNPKKGVKTKFSKTIYTTLFNFDSTLIKYVTDWYKYLESDLLFNNTNPMFPATKLELKSATEHIFTYSHVSKEFWSDAGAIRRIFRDRSNQMKLEYYSPHRFRHFAVNQATHYAKSPEQFKAISQNMGHENISTTFYDYGAINPHQASEIISGMRFDDNKDIPI